MSDCHILVLYYSKHGSCESLARLAARGVEATGARAWIRTVAELGAEPAPDRAPLVELDELARCDGLIMASPTRFGSMAAPLKAFFEQTTPLWLSGALVGKPAAALTSTASVHGGYEATLLGMLLPLLHHGMVLVGVPYTQPELLRGSGSPYGAGHVAGEAGELALNADEKTLARALGQRLAHVAQRLKA